MDNSALDFLTKVARIAEVVGWQANVGGMETAGSLISYLARFPEKLPEFMSDDFSVIDSLPPDWAAQGCLTWHSRDGKVVQPEWVRRSLVIRDMERGGEPHG